MKNMSKVLIHNLIKKLKNRDNDRLTTLSTLRVKYTNMINNLKRQWELELRELFPLSNESGYDLTDLLQTIYDGQMYVCSPKEYDFLFENHEPMINNVIDLMGYTTEKACVNATGIIEGRKGIDTILRYDAHSPPKLIDSGYDEKNLRWSNFINWDEASEQKIMKMESRKYASGLIYMNVIVIFQQFETGVDE